MKMDHIIVQATGASNWEIEVGQKFTITVLTYLKCFIATEMVIYLMLFYDVFCHNEELKKGNSLGMSSDTLNQR